MVIETPAKKILILAANPKQSSRLRLDEEVRDIKEGLRLSQQRDKFILQQEWAVRPRDVRRAVLDFRPNIIHFSGHGSQTTGLSFEDETGKEKLVTGEALAGLFGQFAKQVECVLLNACYSEDQAVAIAQHIDYVIGMNAAIGDKAALEFAVGFYDALVAYDPQYDTYSRIEFAFNIACNAIQFAGVGSKSIPIMKKKPHLGKVEEQVIVNPVNESPTAVSQNQMSERIIAEPQNLRLADEGAAPIEAEIASHKEFVPSPDKVVAVPEPRIISSREDLTSAKQPNKYVAAPEFSASNIIKLPSTSSNSVPFWRHKRPIIGVSILTVVIAFSFLMKPHDAPVTSQPSPVASSTPTASPPVSSTTQINAKDFYDQGLKKYNNDDYKGAIEDFNQALQLDSNNVIAYSKRGYARGQIEDYKGAIDDFTEYLRLNPNDADVNKLRGWAYYSLGNYQEAIADYTKSIKINSKNPEVYNRRGSSYHEQGKYQLAIGDFNKAIELKYDPLSTAFVDRGNSHYSLGDYNAAIEDYNEAIRLDPNSASAYYNRGDIRSKQGEKLLAIKDFQKAVELYNKQGKTKDYQDALAKIKELKE
jgi:tetratricopeptide (TPR) repeat protein